MGNVTENNNRCFCCGEANERGLKLKFDYPSEGKARTTLSIPSHLSGWQDMVHGGLLSMLLDETMAHACLSGGFFAATAELSVRFLKPVKTGETVSVEAQVTQKRSKLMETRGMIKNSAGEDVASGSGRFISVRRSGKD
jgi:uncharacterized protein (TIGR00369 family)